MSIELVRSAIPDSYLYYLAESVSHAYQKASRHCRCEFPTKEIQGNTIWANRRSYIEESLLILPAAVDEIATVEHIKNGAWWHAEVTISEILIAQATAAGPDANIRPSLRKQYLMEQTVKQRFLFEDDIRNENVVIPRSQARLFAALVHGPTRRDPGIPQFVNLRIPRLSESGTIDGYYNGAIDLMAEYPEAFDGRGRESTQQIGTETIADQAFPELLDEEGFGT